MVRGVAGQAAAVVVAGLAIVWTVGTKLFEETGRSILR